MANQVSSAIRAQKVSLTRKTLLYMALRVAGVVLLSAAASYVHVMSSLKQQTQKRLEQIITERGKKESAMFLSGEEQHRLLKQEFLARWQTIGNVDRQPQFDRLFVAKPDGSYRTRLEFFTGKPEANGAIVRGMSGFIGKNVAVTAARRRYLTLSYDLLAAYAPAWQSTFDMMYLFDPSNTAIEYKPNGKSWNLTVPAEQDVSQEEWFYRADRQHNPSRETVWTGLYYDPVPKSYYVTCLTPIDLNGEHLATIGHDISVSTLLERTVQDQFEGTYSMIFRPDGRLIAHPHLMQTLEAQGNVNIREGGNSHLNRIYRLVSASNFKTQVLDNPQDNEYLAVTKIDGPDWYLVMVYPKSLLSGFAFKAVVFVLISGVIALLIEIGLLFGVLRKEIALPLHRLIAASDRFATGDFAVHLDTDRQDELGRLATSFNQMATQLKATFTDLEKANTKLSVRTVELQTTLTELRRTQAQIVQSEKMSALGQLVAGVAHEINNPVSFIQGNLEYVQQYAEDLLQLLELYQHSANLPEDVQSVADEIDVAFIKDDLPQVLRSMELGTDRISEIVLSLRNFARLDESDIKVVNLHAGIESTLVILQSRLKTQTHSIQVIKDYGALPDVECYAGQLNQVFMNVLGNAIEALEAVPAPQIHIQTAQLNDRALICIADNGTGMSEEVRSRIFDPFFTTKAIGKGTGLGLSISYQIVVEHGGTIWCDSTLGQGTKLTIELPLKLASTGV